MQTDEILKLEGRELDAAVAEHVVRTAVEQEREACEKIVRKFLLFNSQREVSWHEVHDCLIAIRARGIKEPTHESH